MQQINVLRYKHAGEDYEVIVRSDDISGAWNSFVGRLNYRKSWADNNISPMSYCDYSSSDECQLYIYNPEKPEDKNPQEGYACKWKKKWPVVFETNKYQICIKFKDVDRRSKPKVQHIRKDVETSFYLDWEGSEDSTESTGIAKLTGEVSFMNEPGVFILNFTYSKGGHEREAYVTFDVASPKLDIKYDYKSILDTVNREFEGLIFNYLSTTFQQFSRGQENNLQVWMQVFNTVVKDYLKGVDRIIKNPHSKVHTLTEYRKADHIRRWSISMEEEYEEKRAEGKLEEHYFRYKEYDNSVNSMENRFVKHTLVQISKRLGEIYSKLLNKPTDTTISNDYMSVWKGHQATIAKYLKHPFFKSVGKFEGLKQESLVLQSRMGYQQVYKDWLKLKKGIDFQNGATNIGTLQIWEIYELWCFIKVKNMVREILGFKEDTEYPELISEPNGQLIHYDKSSGKDYYIQFYYPNPDSDNYELSYEKDSEEADFLRRHQGDKVTIHYQHTYNRKKEDSFHSGTVTTEQRPDIVVNIVKSNGDIVLTYLYDAKYRVWNDRNLDKDFELEDEEEMMILESEDMDIDGTQNKFIGADYPPSDAINQMHRYRDAIYYNIRKDKRPSDKEIIGGYILFPGRGDDGKISERYFSKSIETVNIGAFPLLPKSGGKDDQGRDAEGPQLFEHLINILLRKDVTYEHIKDSIPQRGLKYVEASNGVIIIPTERFELIRTMYQNGRIAIPLVLSESSFVLMEKSRDISNIIFCDRNNREDFHMFRLTSEAVVLDREKAIEEQYYLGYYVTVNQEDGTISIEDDAQHLDAKRFMCIEFDINSELPVKGIKLSSLDLGTEPDAEPAYSEIQQLR